MSTARANLDLIRGTYEAFGRGDVPAVLDVMDEHVEWHEAEGFPTGGTYQGPDAVLNDVIVPLGSEWQDFQALPDEYVDGGDTMVVLGHYSGKYKETGKKMRSPFAHVWKIRNGKVCEFRQYTDTVLVQRAMDAAEETSAA